MSNPIPSSLALTTIAGTIAASPLNSDYTALQTAINTLITALSGGSANQVLQAVDGTHVQWASGVKTTTSTMAGGPPGSPADTDIWIATAVDASGTRWAFQYNAGSASAFKWEFIGGPPLYSTVVATESTASGAYVALTTAGPSITLPRAGDYDVVIECNHQQDGGGPGLSYMSYDIGGTGAVDADGAWMNNPGVATGMNFTTRRHRRKTGLTAVTLTAKYRTATAGQAEFANRVMTVAPVRIS